MEAHLHHFSTSLGSLCQIKSGSAQIANNVLFLLTAQELGSFDCILVTQTRQSTVFSLTPLLPISLSSHALLISYLKNVWAFVLLKKIKKRAESHGSTDEDLLMVTLKGRSRRHYTSHAGFGERGIVC